VIVAHRRAGTHFPPTHAFARRCWFWCSALQLTTIEHQLQGGGTTTESVQGEDAYTGSSSDTPTPTLQPLTAALASSDPADVLDAVLAPLSSTEFRRAVFEKTVVHQSRGAGYHDGIIGEMDLLDIDSVHRFVKGCVSGKSTHLGRTLRALDDITFAGGGQVGRTGPHIDFVCLFTLSCASTH